MKQLLLILSILLNCTVVQAQRYRLVERIDSIYEFDTKKFYPNTADIYSYQISSNRGSSYTGDTINYDTMYHYDYRWNRRMLLEKYIHLFDSNNKLIKEIRQEPDTYKDEFNTSNYLYYHYDDKGRIMTKHHYNNYDFIPYMSVHDMRSFYKGKVLTGVWLTGRDTFIYIGDDLTVEYNYNWCDRSIRVINDSLVFDSLCLSNQKWYMYNSTGKLVAVHRKCIGDDGKEYPIEVKQKWYSDEGQLVSSSERWYYSNKTILIDTVSMQYTKSTVTTNHNRYDYHQNYQDFIDKNAPFSDTLIETKVASIDSLGRTVELNHLKYKAPNSKPNREKILYEYNKNGERTKVSRYVYYTLETQVPNGYWIDEMYYKNGCLVKHIHNEGGDNIRNSRTKHTYTYEEY